MKKKEITSPKRDRKSKDRVSKEFKAWLKKFMKEDAGILDELAKR